MWALFLDTSEEVWPILEGDELILSFMSRVWHYFCLGEEQWLAWSEIIIIIISLFQICYIPYYITVRYNGKIWSGLKTHQI